MNKIKFLIILVLLSVSFSFAQDTDRYTIKLLEECNDELSNFGTTFYGENQMIYASPDKKYKVIKDIWDPNQQPFLDLFIGDISEDGEIINAKPLKGDVKTKYHEADAIFTKDMQTVYFTRDNYYQDKRYKDEDGMTHLALFKADVIGDGRWENIVAFPYNNPKYSIGHPALSNDEKTLYFISDMPSTMGKTDVFRVRVLGDNQFSLPKNMGPAINTTGKEMFAYVSKDNILYFSSDGRNGLGGLDVFAYDLNGKMEKPTNLGEPINSYSDDFAFLINDNTQTGYFSSNRGGGKGDDDIYFFSQNKPIKLDCAQIIKGIVKDKKTKRRIPNALVVLYDVNGEEIDSKVVGIDAKFSFNIDCSSTYKVEASKEDYSMDTKEFESNKDLKLKLELNIEKGSNDVVSSHVPNGNETSNSQTPQQQQNVSINSPDFVPTKASCQNALDNINTIYFDLNKSYIRPDAANELDKVIAIMRRCPNIKIEAGSHTDCRASSAYNLKLSQRRARATVNYLTNANSNVDASRVYGVGYGETKLRNRCADGVRCSEIEHQVNRRTRFVIIN